MNIIVCIKQVPDTTEIKIDPIRNTLIRSGVPSILNPFDRNAIEMALDLRDKHGGKIAAISMGPAQAKEVLREAVALGVDEAYLITDRAFGGSDTYATSYILSESIKKIGSFDVILGGKQAIDGDTGQTAPSIAEHLGVTRLTQVIDLSIENNEVFAKRLLEEGVETVKTKLPVLCTATKESNKPRYATIRGVMDSFEYEIQEINFSQMPDIDAAKIGLKGSPTKVKATFTPKRTANAVYIEGETAGAQADALVAKLREAKII